MNDFSDRRDLYYALHVPGESSNGVAVSKYIFVDRSDALQAVKCNKKARFKQFHDLVSAIEFVIKGTPQYDSPLVSPTQISTPIVGEKSSPFRLPKSQEYVKLRKLIECGDYDGVKKLIWDNPRYLVSSGDTPAILQEGSRYNALHIAAKAKNAKLTELILTTINNNQFIRLLYGLDSNMDVEDRLKVLTDLYLNTPDKGLNETPLHFAVKFGAVNVVEILVSFPECDKNVINKYKQTPLMIICDRCEPGDTTTHTKNEIYQLLTSNYYVPVLRAEDNSCEPIIGTPFSPGESPLISHDPLQSHMEIRAYAGPMKENDAKQFRKLWKTPPRRFTKSNNNNESINRLRYTDFERGLERFGQQLAENLGIGWKEYWSFLDSFVDICSKEGLNLLEQHLYERYKTLYIVHQDNTKNCKTIHELCQAFQHCTITNLPCNDHNFSDMYLKRANQIFANRIVGLLTKIPFNKDLVECLIAEMKLIERLNSSCADDNRFIGVYSSASLHCQVAHFIRHKLQEVIMNQNDFIDECLMKCDKFQVQPKLETYRNHLRCILKNTLDTRRQNCSCTFSLKNKFDINVFLKFKRLSRQLFNSEDIFFTPPTSPIGSDDEEEEEEYWDAELSEEMFIDGSNPTKNDYDVYNAITIRQCPIDIRIYPNIYRWQHTISFYTQIERERWPSKNSFVNDEYTVSTDANKSKLSFRIVGTHSPRKKTNR